MEKAGAGGLFYQREKTEPDDKGQKLSGGSSADGAQGKEGKKLP